MDPTGITTGDHEIATSVSSANALHQLEQKIHQRNSKGWRRIVLNFTPSWFSVTMGTGISSILLQNLPFNGKWLYYLSVIVFCLNVVLLVTFLVISTIRYIMFPGLFNAMLRHPVQSLFVGTMPMGLATIVNMIVFVCVPIWGTGAIYLAWTLWWIDVILAIATAFYLPFIIIYIQQQEFNKMTATWLLPIVTCIVASASGGIVAEVLPNPQHALWTISVSYILWGVGFPLAMVVLVMYFHRLTIYHLPPSEVIVSVFLPLGPLGQGSFAVQILGKCALQTFPKTNTLMIDDAGKIFYVVGNLMGLLIWGFGLVWLFIAVASISRSKFPFNMGWWAFTFPMGVYAVATVSLGQNLPSIVFRVIGTIFSITVVLLWFGISIETTRRAITGKIFFAPCAQAWEKGYAKKLAILQQEKCEA